MPTRACNTCNTCMYCRPFDHKVAVSSADANSKRMLRAAMSLFSMARGAVHGVVDVADEGAARPACVVLPWGWKCDLSVLAVYAIVEHTFDCTCVRATATCRRRTDVLGTATVSSAPHRCPRRGGGHAHTRARRQQCTNTTMRLETRTRQGADLAGGSGKAPGFKARPDGP